MTRTATGLILAALAAAGCSPAPPPAAPAGTREADAAAPAADPLAPAEDALVMTGINLYMHRARQAEGVARKPEFWIHAETFSMAGEERYLFENARAVVYDDKDAESMVIESRRGQFEQEKRAVLEEGVVVRAGAMTLNLSSVVWERPEEGAPGGARSDGPVSVDDPKFKLEANGLRLYPDSKAFELDNVTGFITFGKDAS